MQTITQDFNPVGSRCSEKLDGIHARWNGRCLVTRSGNVINAPDWWLVNLDPQVAFHGELWIARGTFQELQSIVTRHTPDDRWKQVMFIPFDTMDSVVIESEEHLESIYQAIIEAGGEGIVLTTPNGTQYKKKPVVDDDGELVGYIDGRGKYEGLINGFVLQSRSKDTIKVSAGLTQELRTNPPAIGSIIRYKFNGVTNQGLPRHARFDGVRAETSLSF